MTMTKSACRIMSSLLWASAAIAILPCAAYALDGQDLLKKINAAYAPGGVAINAASVDVSGDTVTLRGATFKGESDTAKDPVPLGNVTMTGVAAIDDGSYEIDRVEFQPINMVNDKSTVTASDIYLSGVTIPARTDTNDLSSVLFYEKAHSGPINIKVDGKDVLSVGEIEATSAIEDDGASLSFDANVTGFKLDLASVEDPNSKETIDALALSPLDGSMTMKGSWELQSGTVDVEEYALDFKNIGKLNLSFSLSGYTMDLMRQIQDAAKSSKANATDPQAQQAAGLATLGLLQQMSFLSADIRFDDAGLTGRALDYSGKKQGISGKDMGQMVKAMTPLLLAQAKLGALQNTVSAAVNAYIDNPKSFTITAEPENPVPFPMVIGAAMGAPETLPKVLGVTVTAND
ncbi:hypothetical protein H4S14_002309 [Agrobacterium vitis]|nr:hypothetical protein [Agrobacterium vitis]MBE1438559.1 hypothetical protein [Agrobacterium vitis]